MGQRQAEDQEQQKASSSVRLNQNEEHCSESSGPAYLLELDISQGH